MKGFIDWSDPANVTCYYLAQRGFHAKTISNITGLSKPQVYSRCKKLDIHLRDYRDGHGEFAKEILNEYKPKECKFKYANGECHDYKNKVRAKIIYKTIKIEELL